jgi:2-polyprenyl-3-methyl-5-hydroxy-6-metoxy-1,4-benzoquinol methylase
MPVFRSVYCHLARHRRPPGRLLDVGCGDGHFLELCREAGWTCFGLELSREAAERGARRGITMLPHDWLERKSASPRSAGESDKERFDVIALINVLETVLDPAGTLQHLREALAPDGLMIIRVGNGAFHLFLRRPVGWIGARYQQAFHLFVFSPRSLMRLLQAVGLEPLSVRNSRPSVAPLSGGERLIRRSLWKIGGAGLWTLAETAFWFTAGRAIWAPSFEVIARPK